MRPFLALVLLAVGMNSALAESRCDESRGWWGSTTINCTHESFPITVSPDDVRDVLYQMPAGNPPAGGWPVAFLYQGTGHPIEFSGKSGTRYGGFHQIRTIRELLDNGFAVIAPPAGERGFWDTNGSSGPYEQTSDYSYLNYLFDMVEKGTFGPLNPDRMYAAGISSGGYNTSRMAVSFPGRFRALAIQSASYATCVGPFCSVPSTLPEDHPPTLFLHGTRDWIVPAWSMEPYFEQLNARGISRKVTDSVGHQWLQEAPYEILNWFLMHP